MHPNRQDNSIQDDEIDLREVFAALRRRWRWVVGGGLLGISLAVGAVSLQPRPAPQVRANLIVDVAQIPSCLSRLRQINSFSLAANVGMICPAEVDSLRSRLNKLAKNFDELSYKVDRLAFDAIGKEKSVAQLVLSLSSSADRLPEVSAALAQIQQQMTELAIADAKRTGINPDFAADWIVVEEPTKVVVQSRSHRPLALGLLGGLVAGAGSALIADRRSNRVYSQAALLARLGHPLRLSLPAGPWTSPAVQVLVGQLATQLDQALSWRVLSIARQHDAVAPIAQMLQQQGGPALHCRSADPLLVAVLRMVSPDKPTGLLLVVEPGFNSARALEEASLLISQMSSVQDVGVVFIGAPLPEELSPSSAG